MSVGVRHLVVAGFDKVHNAQGLAPMSRDPKKICSSIRDEHVRYDECEDTLRMQNTSYGNTLWP